MALYIYVLLTGTNCRVITLMASWAAVPPINAEMVCNSAAPYLHLYTQISTSLHTVNYLVLHLIHGYLTYS